MLTKSNSISKYNFIEFNWFIHRDLPGLLTRVISKSSIILSLLKILLFNFLCLHLKALNRWQEACFLNTGQEAYFLNRGQEAHILNRGQEASLMINRNLLALMKLIRALLSLNLLSLKTIQPV
jgi:hypothetical protein